MCALQTELAVDSARWADVTGKEGGERDPGRIDRALSLFSFCF